MSALDRYAKARKEREAADEFIVCKWNPLSYSYDLTLHWWVTYKVTVTQGQLEALYRVVGRALKKKEHPDGQK